MRMPRAVMALGVAAVAAVVGSGRAEAQTVGTFFWRLAPFCNVVTLTVTQQGAGYVVDGYDDQCSFPQRAPVVGVATPNPDGTIGFGLTIVTSPGGKPVHVDARISLATLSGPWNDSAGNTGTFQFGAGPASGTARPAPTTSVIPAPITLLSDGGIVARGTGGSGAIPATGAGVRMMWYPQPESSNRIAIDRPASCSP